MDNLDDTLMTCESADNSLEICRIFLAVLYTGLIIGSFCRILITFCEVNSPNSKMIRFILWSIIISSIGIN